MAYQRVSFGRILALLHKIPIGVLTVGPTETGPARDRLEKRILHSMGFENRKEYIHNMPGEYHSGESKLWGVLSNNSYEDNSLAGDGFYSKYVFDTSLWEFSDLSNLCEFFKNMIQDYTDIDKLSPLVVYPTVDDLVRACKPAELYVNYHLWFCEDYDFVEGEV